MLFRSVGQPQKYPPLNAEFPPGLPRQSDTLATIAGVGQITTHITETFNAYGKRVIQGTKAILFELKSNTDPTAHTNQQGHYLLEG